MVEHVEHVGVNVLFVVSYVMEWRKECNVTYLGNISLTTHPSKSKNPARTLLA